MILNKILKFYNNGHFDYTSMSCKELLKMSVVIEKQLFNCFALGFTYGPLTLATMQDVRKELQVVVRMINDYIHPFYFRLVHDTSITEMNKFTAFMNSWNDLDRVTFVKLLDDYNEAIEKFEQK